MMPPPPPPNRPPNQPPDKPSPVRTEERAVLDDTNLMMVVSALFALYEVMVHFGLDPCTC